MTLVEEMKKNDMSIDGGVKRLKLTCQLEMQNKIRLNMIQKFGTKT